MKAGRRYVDRKTIGRQMVDYIEQDEARKPPIKLKRRDVTKWRAGVCRICGEYCQCITNEHAVSHGFQDADAMAKAGVMDWTE